MLILVLIGLVPATGCRDVVGSYTFGAADAETDISVGDAEQDGAGDSSDAAEPDVAGDTATATDADVDGDVDAADTADVVDAADVIDAADDADSKGDATPVDTSGNQPECVTKDDCGKAPNCQFWTCLASTCVLKHEVDGVACDDGFDCTKDNSCVGGTCKYKTNTCVCLQDSDCKPQDDPCLGTSYCDTSLKVPECKANPATAVVCSKKNDTACMVNSCDSKDGTCTMKLTAPAPGSFTVPCEDGNPCTTGDGCKDGQCQSGPNVCGCSSHADCKGKGDACTGELYCDFLQATPQCAPNPLNVKSCPDDGNPCAVLSCDPTTGECKSTPKADNVFCDDGNPCTADTCKGGTCTPGMNNCGCKSDAECAKFEDGIACNGTYYCDKTANGPPECKVNPATIIVCSKADDNACRTNTCDPKTGACAFAYADKYDPCNADGDPCTAKDGCDGKGKCIAGTNTCSCESDADCASKEDGDLCTGTLYCDTSVKPAVCKVNPKTVPTCNKSGGVPCLVDLCDGKTGTCSVGNAPNSPPCDDGNICTVGDICKDGACASGANLCLCTKDADCIDDGNVCNGVPYCDTTGGVSTCKVNPATVVTCKATTDGVCVTQVCSTKTGACKPTPTNALCDDKNPCTTDICTIGGSCNHAPVPDGSDCGDGQSCLAGTCLKKQPSMVLVPAGDGYVGCAQQDGKCATNEGKLTLTTLGSFWIDRQEVSVEAYQACVQAGLCSSEPGTDDTLCNWKVAGRDKHPVNCVTHAQAAAYCFAQGKRLPTEAEWERAARGGCAQLTGDCAKSTPIFPWQKPLATCEFAVMMGNSTAGCDLGGTAACSTWPKDDSVLGVRDMGGNVSEWTSDGYTPQPWDGQPKTDPSVSASADIVVKGGGFSSVAVDVRSSRRQSQPAAQASPTIGFRCALTIP